MPMGVFIPVRAVEVGRVRTCAYIHGVGFCIAYSNYRVFLGPQLANKQKRNPRFYFLQISFFSYSLPKAIAFAIKACINLKTKAI